MQRITFRVSKKSIVKMNHIVLVNIENDTEKVKRQFSPPFGLLIAASVLLRNNIDVVVRHIIKSEKKCVCVINLE